MQPQSCSSFYMRMRQAYAPAGAVHQHQQQPQTHAPMYASPQQNLGGNSVGGFRLPQDMVTRSPSHRASQFGGQQGIHAISEIQQRLEAIQGRSSSSQRQQQKVPKSVIESSSMVERAASPFSPVISSSSTCSSNQTGIHGGGSHTTQKAVPTAAGENNAGMDDDDDDDDNDMLTPNEMNFLRVVEFAVPFAVHAQVEPGEALVEVCEEATVKLFPHHLVLIRPDGVAAVELVIEELCELNEDEVHSALDCVLRKKGSTHRQLIRILCSSGIARGALFKLLSARRTQVENLRQGLQKKGA